MPSLNQLIQVSVTRQTRAVPQAGFGVALVLSFDSGTNNADVASGFTGGATAVNNYTSSDYSSIFTSAEGPEIKRVLDAYFSQAEIPPRVFVGYFNNASSNPDADVTAALTRIRDINNEWYCIIPTGTYTTAQATDIANFAGSNNKIAFFDNGPDTARTGILGASVTTDIASVLQSANQTRAAVWYNASATESLAGAAAGRCLPVTPGGLIFAYKTLSGITTAAVTNTDFTTLDGKNANYVRKIGGSGVTLTGQMADGGFIDIIRDTDWIVFRVQEAVIFQLLNAEKIPYSDDGVNILITALRAVLDTAVLNGVLDLGYTVTKQSITSIPINDRANRSFPEITVNGRYTGAIQSVNFQLTLSV